MHMDQELPVMENTGQARITLHFHPTVSISQVQNGHRWTLQRELVCPIFALLC